MSEFKTEDLGNGFQHHGVASPISNHRGTVATVDGEGCNVVLLWLFDHRGGYALLMIDAETGESEEFPMPFPQKGDCPFTSILSSRNRFYTHFNEYFTEFDPEKRSFTFSDQTVPRMAMGMTEDDDGGIWAGSEATMGPAAVFAAGALKIVVATHATYDWADEQFRSMQLELRIAKFIVVKNPMNYRFGYAGIAKAAFILDTPGPTPASVRGLQYEHMQRPYFPVDTEIPGLQPTVLRGLRRR